MEVFTMDKDDELTSDKLLEFINKYKTRLPRYTKLKDMYKGDHEIVHQEDKELNKPDNRLVVNFAKYIVDTLNGFFIGNPVKTIHDDKEIADEMKLIAKRNSQNDNNAELSKMCSIYGHAYEFIYQDEDGNTRVTYMEPDGAFVIYDDTIGQNPLYGIKLLTDDEGVMSGTIYSIHDEVEFYENDDGDLVIEETSIKDHYFGDVPLIEYLENEERQSAFENVKTLINAYNKALSEKANDVDYFADAYLAILGAVLDEDTIDKIRDSRIINLKAGDMDKLIVEFLDKPNADTTQENLIERLEKLIFQISMVANISDEEFGSSSGIALRYKLLAMENVALMKERKFTNGMIRRFKMMFNIPTNFTGSEEEYLHIDYVFTRNVPNDIIEEAETSEKLAGVTSKRTQLSVLSVVDNVQDELDQIDKEESEQDEKMMSYERDMNRPLKESNESESSEPQSQEKDDEIKALNGAQITSVLSILEEVREGYIGTEQALALLVDGLKIDESAAKKIVSNHGTKKPDEKVDDEDDEE